MSCIANHEGCQPFFIRHNPKATGLTLLLVGVGQVAHRRVAVFVVADEEPGQADLGAGDLVARPFHALFVFPVLCRGRRCLVLLGLRCRGQGGKQRQRYKQGLHSTKSCESFYPFVQTYPIFWHHNSIQSGVFNILCFAKSTYQFF